MAGPGFEYYSVKTNRYQDKRIKRLKRTFGGAGVAIYDYILCEIYRESGCFIAWDDSTAFDVSEYWNIKESLTNEIVKYCCSVGLFDKELLTNEGLLSSKAILTRFIDWSKKAKRNYNVPEKLQKLLEETEKLQEELLKVTEEQQQRKENESKEKKSKEDIADKPPPTKSFIKPVLDEVIEHFKNKNFEKKLGWPDEKITEKAEQFINYYESKGWMIGKAKMKDWRAAINGQWLKTKTWENESGKRENNVVGKTIEFDPL